MSERNHDTLTGRPLDKEGHEAIESLTDEELEAELTVAASTPNGLRRDRYDALLAERKRRARQQATSRT